MNNANGPSEGEGFLKRRKRSFGFALIGIQTFFRETIHAKVHLVLALVTIAAGFVFQVSHLEWIILILCMGGVLAMEALNSAIEYLTDLTTKEFHPLAKKAKDVAAAGVLISAITSAVIGLLIFIPRILEIVF